MKKLFIGDFNNSTGPSIVNQNLNKNSDEFICFEGKNVISLFFKIKKTKSVLISSLSKINIVALVYAKILRKKTFYLMHGYASVENEIAGNHNFVEELIEKFTLKFSDKIICVSENFAKYLKKHLKRYKDKIAFANNGVDITYTLAKEHETETVNVISVGGGMRRKKNLAVCKAIEKMNTSTKINFIVIGKLLEDGDIIRQYDFVKYYEKISHKQVLEFMRKSNIYIQNSIFETFGLAVMEALFSGCSLLLSKNIGALSVLDIKDDNYIIYDVDNENEIAEKIEYVIKKPNNETLLSSIKVENLSWKRMANDVINIMEGN